MPELPDRFREYVDGLVADVWQGNTDAQTAGLLGICLQTLYNWKKKVDWDFVSRERRKLYKEEVLKIDRAMMKAAVHGNVEAAKLCYARFDGYIPVTATANIETGTDDDLKARAMEIKAELLKQRNNDDGIGAGPNLPGVGAA